MVICEVKISIRTTKEVKEKIKELRNKFPDKYKSESHVIRCAVMRLHREETHPSTPK